jgi:hypothetical protein
MRQDSEGRYFIPDRGDRCVWIEMQRLSLRPLQGEEHVLVFLYSGECQPDFFFWYDPIDERSFALERYVPEGTPLPDPLWPLPVGVEDIQQGESGDYSVPARADGCAYEEQGRPVIDGKTWVMLSAPGCNILWRYAQRPALFAMDGSGPIRDTPSPSDFKLDSDGKLHSPTAAWLPWRNGTGMSKTARATGAPQHLIVNMARNGWLRLHRHDVTAAE